MYTKEKVAHALIKFINNDIIPKVDKNFQIILSILANMIETNPKMLDGYITKLSVLGAYDELNETIDINTLESSLRLSMAKYGAISITIKPIPLLSPTEKILSFNIQDLERLKMYLGE